MHSSISLSTLAAVLGRRKGGDSMSLCLNCQEAVFVEGMDQPFGCFVLGRFTQASPQQNKCHIYSLDYRRFLQCRLIPVLKQIEGCANIKKSTYLHDVDEKHALVSEAECLATECLVDSHCQPALNVMRLAKDLGYPITPGETDSFGWLTGCIRTSKGILVYG